MVPFSVPWRKSKGNAEKGEHSWQKEKLWTRKSQNHKHGNVFRNSQDLANDRNWNQKAKYCHNTKNLTHQVKEWGGHLVYCWSCSCCQLSYCIHALSTPFTDPAVGKAQAKILEGDSRSHRSCRHVYSLLAGRAAIPQFSPLVVDPTDTDVTQQ